MPDDPTICDWSWRGYSGKRGQHFAYGERFDSNILQLGGHLAHEQFDLAFNRAARCTRIDLAVTVQFDPPREGVALEAYERGLIFDREHGATRGRRFLSDSSGGTTTYIGNRESDSFARIYDKWRESREERYRHCWRWEVEFKADLANRVGHRLNSVDDRQSECCAIVRTYFRRRGERQRWMESDRNVRVPAARPASGNATRLNWLATSVRPVVLKLIPVLGEAEVIEALGLDEQSVNRARVAWHDLLASHNMSDVEGGQDETTKGA